MQALVLEKQGELSLRHIDFDLELSAADVKISVHTVGICGSDVHYFKNGRIGDYVVEKPMILGHEASGVIVEVGANVTHLKVGDRVCMEPGIPDLSSKLSKLGQYNLDPSVRFWATPPIHGVLTPLIVHPAAFTFKLPKNVSFEEGAMVEPFAVGMQAAARAQICPGDVAIVTGAGTIGIMIALAALAAGCSKIFITDISQEKLDIAGRYSGIVPINIKRENLENIIREHTNGWGADIFFEASGALSVFDNCLDLVRPGGKLLLVGLPQGAAPLDVSAAIHKEIQINTVFRYANMFDRALDLISSGKIHLKPLLSATYSFNDAIEAFERAAEGRPDDIKIQIRMDQ